MPGILSIGYSVRLLPGETERYIRQARKKGLSDFSIFPEGVRGEYAPIVYLEPFGGRDLRALGYDMFSESVRRLRWSMREAPALRRFPAR